MQEAADSGKWRALALLGSAELLGMSLWFSASAVSPQLAGRWGLSAAEAGWLTTVVQLGFVAGTAVAATLNLADIVRSRTLFAVAALAGAAVNAAVLAADGYQAALALRFLTGFCLAGVYPPAMKMIATWFRAQRGLAIGTIVGALTVGKATPYLVKAIPDTGPAPVVLAASIGAVLAAVMVFVGFRDGPYAFISRPFSWGLVGSVARVREWRLATLSYLGHMFELYAVWTWIPAFLAASVLARGAERAPVTLLSFLAIAIGGAGCVWGGLFADTEGREKLVTISLFASGACCVLSAVLFGAPLWLLAPFALAWGFFVIADSAQFSTLVTESVPTHAVGTALTMKTSLGFLRTMLPMQRVPWLAEEVGWRYALVFLALGPVAGIAAIRRLRLLRTATAN